MLKNKTILGSGIAISVLTGIAVLAALIGAAAGDGRGGAQ